MPEPTPLYRAEWDAAELMAAFPPRFHHPHKRLLFDVAALSGPPTGRVGVSRWGPTPLPDALGGDVTLADAPGYFTYDDPEPGTIGWHQNFADPEVFAFYAGGLFAQDEMQVAEHPALASVREALVAAGHACCVASGPTPVLVTGVERRVSVDTDPAPGRPGGLYGNRFAAAAPSVLQGAIRRIVPPTVSNVVAIAAPHPGTGMYTRAQIEGVLHTACSGYAAVVAESARIAPGARVVLHTGFWGCGAFGGNRLLMIALQAVAARLAGVDTVVFHVGPPAGLDDTAAARRLLAHLPSTGTVAGFLAAVHDRGLRWGASDGN
jgi:hypothetical protein